jgi:beta-lactamase class A
MTCLSLRSSISYGPSELNQIVENQLSSYPAKIAVYAKNLKTGQEVAVHADNAFNSASVIKLAVMALAYRLSDRNELNLNEDIPIRLQDLRVGTVLQSCLGNSLSLRELIRYMITVSDNSAAEIVIQKLGGKDNINTWLYQSGFKQTKLLQDRFLYGDIL